MKKTNIKRVSAKGSQVFRARLMALAVSSCFSGAAYSLGVNPNVVAGSAAINQTGNVMTVTNSNGTIINWGALSVLGGEKLIFDQAANSSVLNRVIGMNVNGKWVIDPTVIAGTISSKGSVWIINSAGIMAKQGAVVDVGHFVASTLDISNTNFLAGKLLFDATPGAGAVTVEKGASISTSTGGSVYLIGSNVSNSGLISTPGGETILAAGQSVSLVDTGTPGVKVEITGNEGNVTNLGTILSEAGRIGMAGALVRNSGTLNASSVVKEGGRIFLKASQDAYVDGDGRIVTTGTKGGRVEVLGNRVAVMDNASIDASGATGGGTVLVGGDYQGKNSDVQNSTITYFGKNATLKADATNNGNGGKVIVWANDTTRAYGSISARGGANGGNGGFVETSGHNYLATDGAQVDTRAPKGKTGSWLLDPADITITSGGSTDGSLVQDGDYFFNPGSGSSTLSDSDISSRLLFNNVIVDTSRGSGGTGRITLNDGVQISSEGFNTLSLLADGNIAFNGTSSGITLNGFSLAVSAGNTLPGSTISMTGVTMSNMTGLDVNSHGGNVSITNSTLPVAGNVNIVSGGGHLSLTQSQLAVTDSAYGMTINLGTTGNLTLQAANSGSGGSASLSSQGPQTITANNITLRAGSSGTNNVAEIVSYGGQTITATGSIELYGGATTTSSTASYGNTARIANYSSNDQVISAHSIYLKAGGTGGYDFNNSAILYSEDGTQKITITGTGGSINLYGGAGGGGISSYGGASYGASLDGDCASVASAAYCYDSNNRAEILHKSDNSSYGQSVLFLAGGGSISAYGGSGGAGNRARISNQAITSQGMPGDQIVGGSSDGVTVDPSNYAPSIFLRGGASGGKVVYGSDHKFYDFRNSASIESDSSTMTVYASTITMQGGAGVSGAIIGGSPFGGGSTVNVYTTGDLTMTGGSSGAVTGVNDSQSYDFVSAVGIGSDKDVTVNVNVGGDLNMTSGSSLGGMAMIGSLESTVNATVTVSGNANLTSNGGTVAIGSYATASRGQYGGGSVSLTASGDINLTSSSSAGAGVMIGSTNDVASNMAVTLLSDGNVTMNGGGGLGVLVGVNAPTSSGNSVSVTAGGDISMSNNAYLKAGDGANAGTVTVTTNAGNITLDTVNAGSSGTVTVVADGKISDGNGSGVVNVTGGTVSFTSSSGGSPGGLAIDVDATATNTLSASVVPSRGCEGPCAATYGGINIRNLGSSVPTSVVLHDYADYGGDITFQNQASLTASSALSGTSLLTSSSGGITVKSSEGDVDLAWLTRMTPAGGKTAALKGAGTGSITNSTGIASIAKTANSISLSAGQNIDLSSLSLTADGLSITTTNGAITGSNNTSLAASSSATLNAGSSLALSSTTITGASVDLTAGTSLTATNSTVAAKSGNLTLQANTVNLTNSNLLAYADLNINAQQIFSVGSFLAAGYNYNSFPNGFSTTGLTNAAGDVTMKSSGNIELNDGTNVVAGNDVIFNLNGSTSTLYLNRASFGVSPVKVISDIVTQVPATTHLNFLLNTGGGVVIDGVTTTTTTAGGSGFYVLDSSTPATAGNGLSVVYLSAATTGNAADISKATTTELNKTLPNGNLPPLIPKSIASAVTNSGTTGGDEGTFGSEDKKDGKSNGNGSESTDKKEQNNGKSTSKNQCS